MRLGSKVRVDWRCEVNKTDATVWQRYARAHGISCRELTRQALTLVVDNDLLPPLPTAPVPSDECGGVEPDLVAGRPRKTVEQTLLDSGFRPADYLTD